MSETSATPETGSPAPVKKTPRWLLALRSLRDRKMAAMLLLAFAAGIPYGAVLGTLNAWLTEEGITPGEIGVLSFIILAYSYKFIWSPGLQKAWFPKIGIPWLTALGPRRAWLITLQIVIAGLLFLLAFSRPAESIAYVALIGVLVALASATHDIVLDAWRIEVASSEEDKDIMSALYQFGYRIAGLFTGMFALMLADHIAWSLIYMLIAVGMVISASGSLVAPEPDHAAEQAGGRDKRPTFAAGLSPSTIRLSVGSVALGWAIAITMIVTFAASSLLAPEPPNPNTFTREQGPLIVFLSVIAPGLIAAWLLGKLPHTAPHAEPKGGKLDRIADTLFHTVLDPLMDLIQRLRWAAILILLLVLSYRFVDLIWGSFAYTFYLGDPSVGITGNPAISLGALGHTNTDVAIASKTVGVFMTVAGAAAGGALLLIIGRMSCLFIGGAVSAATNLLFADLATGGHGMDVFLRMTGLGGMLGGVGMDPALSRLTVAIAMENMASGFASVAFVAYLTSIVNPKFAAVQYALLASLTMLIGSLGRAPLGKFIDDNGFHDFFVLTAVLGLVAVVLSGLEWARRGLTKKAPEEAGAAAQPAE
jgi:PAT family beta-lactamase induction signal transducer AmpG